MMAIYQVATIGIIGQYLMHYLELIKIKQAQKTTDVLTVTAILVLAVATSIDALAVGVTFSFLLAGSVAVAVIIIGLITFALSYAGFFVGRRFGHFFVPTEPDIYELGRDRCRLGAYPKPRLAS